LYAGDGSVVPLTLVSNTGNYLFVLKPMTTLTPTGNQYYFEVNADNVVGFSGDDAGCGNDYYAKFSIYDPNASTLASIMPAIDIQGFDAFDTYVVDWNDIWKVFYDDQDAFEYAESSDWIQDYGTIRLSWAAAADCYGYDVYIKDSDTAWQLVDDWDVTYTYNDGQFVEANITVYGEGEYDYLNAFYCEPLPEGWAYENPWEMWAPFYAGNTVQIVVMPKNINGIAQDPNYDKTIVGLALKDNLGPVIAGKGDNYPADAWFYPYFFGPDRDKFDSCTKYDETEIAILSQEPLKDVELMAQEPNVYGAWASSGSFRVARAYWDDPDLALVDGQGVPYPSNRAYIMIDLEPAIATTLTEDFGGYCGGNVLLGPGYEYGYYLFTESVGGFAAGDPITITDAEGNHYGGGNHCELLNNTGRIAVDRGICEDILAEGAKVFFNGPVNSGYDGTETYVQRGTCYHTPFILVEDASAEDHYIDGGSVILAPEKAYVAGTGSNNYREFDGVGLEYPYFTESAYSAGTAVEGITPSGASTTVYNDNSGDNVVDVYNASGFSIGDTVVFDISDATIVRTIIDINTASDPDTITVDGGAITVDEDDYVNECITFSTVLAFGYPMIELHESAGIQVGSTITFDPDGENPWTTTVTGVAYRANIHGVTKFTNGVTVSDLPPLDEQEQWVCFDSGTIVVTNSSRAPDALQVKLKDRSGNDSSVWYDQIGYEEVDGGWSIF
ncbi:MAG: hypothetical protein NT072_11235, partial [Deltaproteobacteria bacterium]|nr:hypothetical protein [Deltaproteobacteria bacterium]